MAEQDNGQNFIERLFDPAKEDREFEQKFTNSKFAKYPQFETFLKYSSDQGGEIRARQEYIAAVEQFAVKPKRSDYKTQAEYNEAIKFWETAVGRMLKLSNIDFDKEKNKPELRIKRHIEDQRKKLAERTASTVGQQEQQAYLGVTQQTEADKAAAETERLTEEARTESLANVAIPGFKTQDVFTGTADRPRTEKRRTETLLTGDEWAEQWATMTPKEKEQFKSQIAGALGDSAQSGAIRSLDVNDPTLQQYWTSYGLYLSESYRKDKNTPRAMTPGSFTRYVAESGTFDMAEKDKTAAEQEIINFYRNNGLPVLQNFVNDIVSKISRGDLDLETWKKAQRKLLSKEYPDFADEFAAGFDLKDLASNYISKMADVLELDANTIDLNDSLLKSGLQARTPDGKLTSKTLREFELDLRQDPRWQQTQRAQQEASSAATFILEKFGFRS